MTDLVRPRFGFVFAHGWAMTPDFFTPLAAQLAQRFPDAPCHFLNLVYFSAPSSLPTKLDPQIHWIGIGHSYGWVRLLRESRRLPINWHCLISIAGFTRFAVDPALPQALLARLQTKPAATLRQFYRLCGLPDAHYPSATPHTERLEHDLRDLMTCDEQQALAAQRFIVLASRNDAVVPPELTQHCFANAEIYWHEQAGHALGLVAMDWCAERILQKLSN